MGFTLHASGMKGAVPRVLKAQIAERLADVGDLLTADQVEILRAAQGAANKLIHRAPAGMHLDVQLLLSEAPFGGMAATVSVTASRPRSR